MPAQDGQFAGDGNCRDLMAVSGADTQKERAQRTRRIGRGPGGLDQHRSGMGPSVFADTTMLGETQSGLPDAGIEPDIANELLRAGKPAHVTDRSGQADRDRQVDAGNRQQALYCRITNCRLSEGAIEAAQILAEPVELAQMALDGVLLILGQRLLAEPCSP